MALDALFLLKLLLRSGPPVATIPQLGNYNSFEGFCTAGHTSINSSKEPVVSTKALKVLLGVTLPELLDTFGQKHSGGEGSIPASTSDNSTAAAYKDPQISNHGEGASVGQH